FRAPISVSSRAARKSLPIATRTRPELAQTDRPRRPCLLQGGGLQAIPGGGAGGWRSGPFAVALGDLVARRGRPRTATSAHSQVGPVCIGLAGKCAGPMLAIDCHLGGRHRSSTPRGSAAPWATREVWRARA